jgi:hypothetical protein
MRTEIHYWQNVIINEKYIEPNTDEQMANYKIAEYLLFRKK